MPLLGYGTWNLHGKTLKDSLQVALDEGYKHIDTAEGYQNEESIGEVIQPFDRDDLFLTSKVLPTNLHYDDVLDSLEQSLHKLGTEYVDLYLIHWPNPAISIRETLQAFAKLYESEKVKNIGVSNFNRYQLRIASKITTVPISVNQVQFHPWYNDHTLLKFCQENEILLTSSAPLARTKAFQDPMIKELAKGYEKTPAQIILRWEIQKGISTVPKSSSREHIKENFEIFDFQLDSTDMERINEISIEEKVYELDLDDNIYGIPA